MAYVKPEDLVIFNLDGGNITALVTDIQFRRFKKQWKDKKTGEVKVNEYYLNGLNYPTVRLN